MTSVPLVDVEDSFLEQSLNRCDGKGNVLHAPFVMIIDCLVCCVILPTESLQVTKNQSSLIVISISIANLNLEDLTQRGWSNCYL